MSSWHDLVPSMNNTKGYTFKGFSRHCNSAPHFSIMTSFLQRTWLNFTSFMKQMRQYNVPSIGINSPKNIRGPHLIRHKFESNLSAPKIRGCFEMSPHYCISPNLDLIQRLANGHEGIFMLTYRHKFGLFRSSWGGCSRSNLWFQVHPSWIQSFIRSSVWALYGHKWKNPVCCLCGNL